MPALEVMRALHSIEYVSPRSQSKMVGVVEDESRS